MEKNEMCFKIPSALTIAGSDSGGCAGIQADLRTFSALGVHGASALTAITAQNTVNVAGVLDIPPDFVSLQIETVSKDIDIRAVKTGMLSNTGIIRAVSQSLRKMRINRLVVDPVMVSTSGDSLIQSDAIDTLKQELLPLALVVTPNHREAEILSGQQLLTARDVRSAAQKIRSFGVPHVVIKGGHGTNIEKSIDLLFDGDSYTEISSPRIQTRNTHGSGCTFAAAITAFLALGQCLPDAVKSAKEFVSKAIIHSYPIGRGCGPLGHFYKSWKY